MLYKTITLELLRGRRELHEQLHQTHQLLPTLEGLAGELRTSHNRWKETLALAKPESEPTQIASEALEMAIKELEDRLDSVAPSDNGEVLDGAIAYVRRHTSDG